MNRLEAEAYLNTYRSGLLDNLVPFWLRHGLDEKHGGLLGGLDRDGSLLDTDKQLWQQGRFGWLMATLYNTVEPKAEWLAASDSALGFLRDHGFDADGKMFYLTTQDGKPLRKRRYVFTEGFCALGHAAYAKAAQDDAAAAMAVKCFDSYLDYSFTPGKMDSKWITENRPMQGLGPWMIVINVAQTLRDCIGHEPAQGWIDRAIETIEKEFMLPEYEAVVEVSAPGGKLIDHFDGRTMTPGHAIEAAWFILDESRHRGGDAELTRIGCTILDWMWKHGWDKQYGGLLYFVDIEGKPVQEYWHDMKFWWPQAELIIATLLAWKMTGDAKYQEQHRLAHNYFHTNFPDPEYGEYYGYLHRDGRISSHLKGNQFKGPFHIPRMQWYCMQLLEELLPTLEQ